MQLVPIENETVEAACRLLERGFGNPAVFWRRTLERALSVRPAKEWPVGSFFQEGGRNVGVLITFYSRRRTRDGVAQVVANTSSFYIEPEHEGLGSMRLARLLLQSPYPLSDLFPDPPMVPILTKLGFQLWSDGFLLVSWPEAVMSGSTGASVIECRKVPAGALDDEDLELLEDHERLGMIPAALNAGDGWRPLIFARRTAKRLPCGYLLYADSREEAWRHRRAMADFLMKKGIPLLAMDWRKSEKPRNARFVARTHRYYRGDFLKDRIDLAYSDLVYSDVKARHDGIR